MINKFIKYYKYVFLVFCLLIKYQLFFRILSNRALSKYIRKRFESLRKKERKAKSYKSDIHKRVSAVINIFFPRLSCLKRSLIINEILVCNGYAEEQIKIGIRNENEKLYAHAWIIPVKGFKTVYKI